MAQIDAKITLCETEDTNTLTLLCCVPHNVTADENSATLLSTFICRMHIWVNKFYLNSNILHYESVCPVATWQKKYFSTTVYFADYDHHEILQKKTATRFTPLRQQFICGFHEKGKGNATAKRSHNTSEHMTIFISVKQRTDVLTHTNTNHNTQDSNIYNTMLATEVTMYRW